MIAKEGREQKNETFVEAVRGLYGCRSNMLSDDDGVAVVVNHSPRGQAPVLQVCLWTSNNSEDKSLLSPTPGHQIHPVTPLSYSQSPISHNHSYLLQMIIKFTQSLLSPTPGHQIHPVTPVSYSRSSNWHSYSCLLQLVIKLTQLLLSPTAGHQIDTVTPVSYSWSSNWHSYSYLYKWSWSWPCHSYLLHLIIKVLHVTPISCIWSSKFSMSLLSPASDHQSSPSHSKSFTCILKPTRKMTVWRSM